MALSRTAKNGWILFLFVLMGIVIGGFLGSLADQVSFLSFLNFGYDFGMDQPLSLNLRVVLIQFQLSIYINIASVIGTIIAIVVYKNL